MPRFSHRRGKDGQAIIESVIVLFFLFFIFFLVFDFSRLLNCRIVLDHAAARCARARAVGFNDFMLLKTARLGVLPISGKCLTLFEEQEDMDAPPSTETLINRMGSYLQTASYGETFGILDFELWSPGKLGWSCVESDNGIATHIWQRQPVFNTLNPEGADDRDDAAEVMLHGNAKIESHYRFYLQ